MMRRDVPFFRPAIGDGEIAAVVECLRSGWLTTGPRVHAFEAAFAGAIGGGVSAVAVTSATAALHLGLEAMGIGQGDEVVVPTLTFTATAEVVRYVGARPVFVDIDPETLSVGPAQIAPALTPRTRAIMPVHFGGRSCDMTALRALADRAGLRILGDAAHAFPAGHRGRPIGRCGADATAFSFYANKTMTTGEGGMLVTADPAIATRARTMRLHGIDHDVFDRFHRPQAGWGYDVVAPGFKYNMTDIAAALGLVQLERSAAFLADRTRLVRLYDDALRDLPIVRPPGPAPGDDHAWHLYVIRLTDDARMSRDAFMAAIRARGVACSMHYRPLHQMTVWQPFCAGRHFPHADDYAARGVSLPLFMGMTDDEQAYVVEVVRDVLTH